MASPPLALFCADTHLDSGAWLHRPRLRGDSQLAWSAVCELAMKLKVEAIFVAGDFFDVRKPPSEVIVSVRATLDALESNRVACYFIQGQHDLSLPPWLSAIHHWPRWLHRSAVTLSNSISVYGIDWTPADRLPSQFKDVPPQTDILVMHQVWSDLMGGVTACECDFADVPVADTLVTGDFHKSLHYDHRQGLLGGNRQPLAVLSPGATNLRSVDEDAGKSVWLYHRDGSWRQRMLPTRLKLTVDLNSEHDWQRFLVDGPERLAQLRQQTDKLPEELRRPILWVRYLETLPQLRQRVAELVGQDCELFYRVLPAVDAEQQERRETRQSILAGGLLGGLELVVPKEHEHHAPLVRLLRAADPEVELEAMRKERLHDETAAADDHSRESGRDRPQ